MENILVIVNDLFFTALGFLLGILFYKLVGKEARDPDED